MEIMPLEGLGNNLTNELFNSLIDVPDSDTVRVTKSVVFIQLADSVIIHLYRVLLLLIFVELTVSVFVSESLNCPAFERSE